MNTSRTPADPSEFDGVYAALRPLRAEGWQSYGVHHCSVDEATMRSSSGTGPPSIEAIRTQCYSSACTTKLRAAC